MVKKATLDTNILISALGWKGPPNKAFRKIINGDVELVTSDEQFNELSEVLEYIKCQGPPSKDGGMLKLVNP